MMYLWIGLGIVLGMLLSAFFKRGRSASSTVDFTHISSASVPSSASHHAAISSAGGSAVVLEDAGKNKINVIKEVRLLTGLGLKETKDLIESPPQTVKQGVSREEAERIQALLVAVGARVRVQ